MNKSKGLKTGIIHQPHFLAWLGYFNKLANCDIYIVQDNVQFRRAYFQNRTRIQNTQKEPIWFTIPIHSKRNTLIQDVRIADKKWPENLTKTLLHSYGNEKFYGENIEFINEIINKNRNKLFLSELNVELQTEICDYLNINCEFEFAHHFEKFKNPSDELINICRKNNIQRYLFGEGGGVSYHGISPFRKNGIKISQQKFVSKFEKINNSIYPKSYEMSILHYLFLIGKKESEKIIKETWRIKTAHNNVYN
ncbi:WbqC family protein [Psychroserpens sp. SPM9]|uniref:WbqC family protein n=1 Tax=Psychroserpens sp. SPM9 TaxID=2975598 RepID=UPI0021A90AEF|nr:WbqC family protein [Psychroserpens sp. SPM9]MDG5493231.1 WbqC family protein [Psychroserpens sp. SPM9]